MCAQSVAGQVSTSLYFLLAHAVTEYIMIIEVSLLCLIMTYNVDEASANFRIFDKSLEPVTKWKG